MVSRLSKVAALAVAVTVALAGCASPGNAGGADEQGKPKSIVVGRAGDTATLDPAIQTDDESNRVTREVVETLVSYVGDTSELGPGLADSWDVSEDGTSITFHLAEGVTFHDGTDFNADAVVANFNRWWDPDNEFHNGTFPIFATDMGGFKGDPNSIIQAVTAVDDSTVEITLAHAFPPFLAMMTVPQYGIVSPTALAESGAEFPDALVGTGAFEFVSWTPNDQVVLKKNPNYRIEGYPKVDQVIFKVIADNTARLNALRAGDINLMIGVNPSDVASIEADANLTAHPQASNNVGYMSFNTQVKPFDDPRVRQAISMTIDKDAIIKSYYAGQADPAVTVLPTGNWAFDSDITDYKVDIEKAKALLAEAGYADGFETELWAMPVARPYMPQPEAIATALQASMKQIGIDAKITSFEWATYLERTRNGEAPMALLGWSAATWDPTTMLFTLLRSNENRPTDNISLYSNPEVDALLDEALTITDQDQRKQLYLKAQELIHADAPMVPLVHSTPVVATRADVQNYVPIPTYGAQFTQVDIAP